MISFTTPQDFWREMVEPDCNDYRSDMSSLRYAFHSASSLFHYHDWIFQTHKQTLQALTYTNSSGQTKPAVNSSEFANYLETLSPDFGRIRGVANAGKHLVLSRPSTVHNSPSHASNTQVQTTGYDEGSYGVGPYGGSPRVIIEGSPDDLEYLDVMENVFKMWVDLKAAQGW